MRTEEWEGTEDYQRWRHDFPEAAKQYDDAKQKAIEDREKSVARIRAYKKEQYASMTHEERRELLRKLKQVYEKRKK
jgi:acyl-CoA reductase-like NAD-dependent aldehyde dehydrogenase